jgi:hypothetical protein
MYSYWMLIRNDAGGTQRITIQADNPYQAYQMAKAIYGSQMISESANLI